MTLSHSGRHIIRTGALAAAALAFAGLARAYDVPTGPELGGSSTKENWLSLSGGSFMSLDGNEANYQKRHQHEAAGFGGVDSFRYNHAVFGDRTLRIDGKAIVGDNDFLIHALLKDENNGWYLDAGFKENTIFYVGSGGYSPGGLWVQPHDDQLDLQRGEGWLEFGLNKGAWNLKVRGSHQYRKGQKDSTMWGDSIYNGLGTAARKVVPALMDLDETRDTLAVDLGYENEKLEAGAGIRLESIEIENETTVLRNVGQANPTGSGQRYQLTESGSDADLFAAHGFVTTTIGDKLTLTGAASSTTIDTVLSGERWFAARPTDPYDSRFPRTSTGHGYIDLEGDTQWDQWVIVGNASYVPAKNWTINAGLRYENQTQDSFSEYIETAGPANNPLEEPFEQESDREFDEVLTTLEANYTGIDNWVFTPFVEYAVGSGNLQEEQLAEEVLSLDRDTDFDRDYVKYGVNARWYPATWFNGAVGVFRKDRSNSYDTLSRFPVPSPSDRYPAFITDQDFSTDDLYIRAMIRPATGLSLTARWDRTRSTIDTIEQGITGTVSSDQDVDIFSGTLNWVATSRVSAQVGVSIVRDKLVTGDVTANAPVASRVGDFSSDYVTYSGVVMIALTEDSDLQVDYFKYTSDNYRPVFASTLPYGMEADEQVYGVTYNRRVSADMILSLRAVVSDYNEPLSGGKMDYKTEMLYGRLQMRF